MTAITGTDVIRNALAARAKKANIAGLARDLAISASELESFIAGRLKLPAEILKPLARELFSDSVEYDPIANLLRPAKSSAPKPLGVPPAPFDPKSQPPPARTGGVVLPPSQPKQRRSGWADK